MPAKSGSLLCCFLAVLPLTAVAQPDTLLELPAVVVSETAVRSQTTGSRTRNWADAALRGRTYTNLGEWLSQESGLFIKSYGLGSIATTSIRGGSAAHTSVLWNGLPVQSPMLGQLDFSLFPLGFIDRVQINYGGNSAAWGSGSIGGVVQLDNISPADSTYALTGRTTIGSFGLQDHQLRGHYQNNRWGIQTRVFQRKATNDFSYRIRPDLPEKTQTNAALEQRGLLQSLYFKNRPNQQISLHFWAQHSKREIPPTTVQNQSLATQADRFIRTALQWEANGNTTVWKARLGLFREIIDYQDPQILLQSLTSFWTIRGEISGKKTWKDHHLMHYGLSYHWITAEADAYQTAPKQTRTASFLVYRYGAGRWQLQFNLRQEIVDGKFQPLVPGLGITGKLIPHISIRGKVSRDYRLPTLNDLYWQPGGNPDLLPESGWSQEGGLDWQQSFGRHRLSAGVTAFNRTIRNWILWSRPEGQSFWSANNITKVHSRGLEYRLQWQFQTAAGSAGISMGYDYIRSTNEIAISQPRLEAGAQLVYVPEHQAFGQVYWQWNALQIRYRHTYTGSVSSLNVGRLPAYHLGYTEISYPVYWPKWQLSLFLQANNLWNESYRVIERQPMPGRHFRLGLEINFHQHLRKR